MSQIPAIDPRAWRADTIDPPDSWRFLLSSSSLNALEKSVQEAKFVAQPITSLHADAKLSAACADDLNRVRESLELSRGFAVLSAEKPGSISSERLTAYYWLVGTLLGLPIEQNVQGTLLYDVHDTGADVRYGARFSVTNAESSFHTDNSFGNDILDYVGLLCLNCAKAGGESQIVSGIAVDSELRVKHPDVWTVLRQPFHVDRRGGLRPGDAPTVLFPVLSGDGSDLVIRYLRYWIEVGHQKACLPLTTEQINALDVFDRVAGDPRFRVEFTLKPGEMLFVNNRWILHNRTAFEDHSEPERRRHFLRLWVRRPRSSPTT